MDFLRLVYIVIPKLQTNQEKWCFNWKAGGPEPVAGLPPQHDCFVPLKTFSRSTWRKSELSLITFTNEETAAVELGSTVWCAEKLLFSFFLSIYGLKDPLSICKLQVAVANSGSSLSVKSAIANMLPF